MAAQARTALAVTPAGAMTAPPAAPAGGAERSGGLRVYWLVNKKIAEKIERGELRFGSGYDAARALIIADMVRVLEVRVGSAAAYVVAFLEDDEYHYAATPEEALRIALENPEGAALMTYEEIERLIRKATGKE